VIKDCAGVHLIACCNMYIILIVCCADSVVCFWVHLNTHNLCIELVVSCILPVNTNKWRQAWVSVCKMFEKLWNVAAKTLFTMTAYSFYHFIYIGLSSFHITQQDATSASGRRWLRYVVTRFIWQCGIGFILATKCHKWMMVTPFVAHALTIEQTC